MEIKFNHLSFLQATSDYSVTPLVVLGCPFDGTASYQPGSRFAPNAIREASQVLESYSPHLKKDLSELAICDLGDLELPFGNTQRILTLIEKAIDQLLMDQKISITLGGEHLISLPIIQAYKRHYPNLTVIHLDAHADLRDEYLGEKLSHATVMRRVLEVIGKNNFIQLGIRSGTSEEFALARRINCLYNPHDPQHLSNIEKKIRGKHIYISLDLDVLDPSVLPGTGTPEPQGLTLGLLLKILSILKAGKVVGMDLVELLPYQNPHQISCIVAAKILRESLLLYFTKNSS
jgi:agmatinase